MINYHPVCGEETMYSVDQDKVNMGLPKPNFHNGVNSSSGAFL